MAAVTKKVLAEFPLFAGLADNELSILAKVASKAAYKKGECVYKEGTPGDTLYLLHKGNVKITHRVQNETDGESDQTMGMVKKGSFFGELSLLDGRSHSATAVAAADVEVVLIKRHDFDAIAEKEPEVGYKIIKIIAIEIAHLLRSADRKFLDMVEQYLGFYHK